MGFGIGGGYVRSIGRAALIVATFGAVLGFSDGASRTPVLQTTKVTAPNCSNLSQTCAVKFTIVNPKRFVRPDCFRAQEGSGLNIVGFKSGRMNEYILTVDFSQAKSGSWGIFYEGRLFPDLITIADGMDN